MQGLTRLMVAIVALVAVVLAGVLFMGRGSDRMAATAATAAPPVAAPGQPTEILLAQAGPALPVTQVPRDGMSPDMVLGDPKAPVTIIEYSSLTCPHCAAFHRETLPKIKEQFIATGKAKLIFRDFPFENLGLGASMLARCVPNDRYFSFLDTLFSTQQQWAYSKNPLGALQGLGKLAGVPDDRFQACMTDQKMMDGIKAKQAEGQKQFGVDSTPTFIINGEKISGNQPFDNFAQAINKAAK